MNSALVYPMLAMVILTFTVLMALFVARIRAVITKQISESQFLTYVGEEPDSTVKLSRNFINLFEAPVLFYVVCLAGIQLGTTTAFFVGLAWAYVGLRVTHTCIHTGSNTLSLRITAYFGSWAVLLALWICLVVLQQ